MASIVSPLELEAPVMVVEGEKAADAATEFMADFVIVTSSGGSKAASKTDWAPLAGRRVTIWPDADAAGAGYAASVVRALDRIAAELQIAMPPSNVTPGWDAADALGDGWNSARAAELVATAVPVSDGLLELAQRFGRPGAGHGDDAAEIIDLAAHRAAGAEEGTARQQRQPRSPRGGDDGSTQRDGLVGIARNGGAQFWHAPDGEAFATIPIENHYENWAIRSAGFMGWLRGIFFDVHGVSPGGQAMADALGTLEVFCARGPEFATAIRIGGSASTTYLDLGDRDWRAVEIDAGAWRVVPQAPVKFLRRRGMKPLPVPEAGESGQSAARSPQRRERR